MTVSLSVKSQGDGGPAVVILHGLLGSGTNWRSIARALAERTRVFCLDARNHGDSPHVPGMSYPDMAGDVRAFMDASALDQVVLIGHSMGGKTAMRLALESPDRVAGLMVVDIAPVPSTRDHQPLLEAMARVDPSRAGSRGDVDRMLAPAVPDPGVRQFLLQNLLRAEAGFAWRVDLDAIRAGMPEILDFPPPRQGARFPGPTLMVRGERSDYLLPAHETVARELFPAVRFATVAGAGHWVHADQPARFLELVWEFLDRPPGAPGSPSARR